MAFAKARARQQRLENAAFLQAHEGRRRGEEKGDSSVTLFWDALGTDVQGNANVELAELLKQLRESGGQACRWETPSSRTSKEKRIIV